VTARFAIYAAPGAGSAETGTAAAGRPDAGPAVAGPALDGVSAALREKAERWLGRSVTGNPVTAHIPAGWTREAVDAITVDARRYGFHATLKAPFRLAEGRTPEELDAALARFAAGRPGVLVPRLSLARLGGFFALVPGTETAELHALADEVVTAFDAFRAPATDAELARRNPEALTPRQRELLKAWGYPYVLDEFRFHMTLTDRIPHARRPEVERTLHGWFGALLGAALPVTALALFTEAEPGAPFRLHAVYPLQPIPVSLRAAGQTDSEGAR
jgi:putative phosphonate metabolism protein